jgi:hypothetical protein
MIREDIIGVEMNIHTAGLLSEQMLSMIAQMFKGQIGLPNSEGASIVHLDIEAWLVSIEDMGV